MDTNDIIIRLIQADMKHNQLISALEGINLLTDGLYFINIADAVAALMGVKGMKSELWAGLYDHYMLKAGDMAIEGRGDNLRPLADECHHHLKACIDIEETLYSAHE